MSLKDLAAARMATAPGFTIADKLYNAGWDGVGEWTCANCGRMIGKNPKGDKPFLLARNHANECASKGEK